MSILSLRVREWMHGWRGVCMVAITYVYFLIFAQFAFLKRLGELDIVDSHLQAVMAAMAVGGIAFSLLAAYKAFWRWPRFLLQLSFLLCGIAAVCTVFPLNLPASFATAFLIGAGLGLLTVTLVSHLQLWIGNGNGVFKVAVGTGIGYFLCNVPSLFTASPTAQALTAACLCAVGILAAWKTESKSEMEEGDPSARATPFPVILLAFTALVWLDSAAFFIIQNTPSLKAGTWQGTMHLWANACIHLAAALLSGYLIRRLGLRSVLACAVLALSMACILLHQPGQVVVASFFYPVGVSFYSVALVAYPSFLAGPLASPRRAVRAGLIYSIAGWVGSAIGIGMAQHLRQVPLSFVAIAAALVLSPALVVLFRKYPRELVVTSAALAGALCIHLLISASKSSSLIAAGTTSLERGRQVYISEGCINCHSQYIRPKTTDDLMWGPAESMEEIRSQHPPLIGNRRQGPDLSQVGGRRSPLWLKAHFFNPREVSHASFMPSYAYLFESPTRGEDLVNYLSSLKSSAYPQHVAMEESWQPASHATMTANAEEGARLYSWYCATCHEEDGATRRAWASSFKRLPPVLQRGPLLYVQADSSNQARARHLTRIIKFGIPGTDMPGHEYLSDQYVSSIALWVNRTMVLPEHFASIQNK